MFGGNSNWRGPVWYPFNYLIFSVLERYGRFFGDERHWNTQPARGTRCTWTRSPWTCRTGYLVVPRGRRRAPALLRVGRELQPDPAWKDNLLFNEYFHGDTGEGLGATHQTGWTGLVADNIRRRHGAVTSTSDLIGGFTEQARP